MAKQMSKMNMKTEYNRQSFISSVCQIPKSTLFVDCKGTPPNFSPGNRYPGKNGFYYQRPLSELSADDIVVEKYLRGVRVKPKQHVIVSISVVWEWNPNSML